MKHSDASAVVWQVRECCDCGATDAEIRFTGRRKPRGRRDRCVSCAEAMLAARRLRAAELRGRIDAMRPIGGTLPPQEPFHTLPLFAGLRALEGAS